jgi:hypothetical protein
VKGATNAYFSSPLSIGVKSRLHSFDPDRQLSKSEIACSRKLTIIRFITEPARPSAL